jgi:hypothetical protein
MYARINAGYTMHVKAICPRNFYQRIILHILLEGWNAEKVLAADISSPVLTTG